jgi:hypothetical protein
VDRLPDASEWLTWGGVLTGIGVLYRYGRRIPSWFLDVIFANIDLAKERRVNRALTNENERLDALLSQTDRIYPGWRDSLSPLAETEYDTASNRTRQRSKPSPERKSGGTRSRSGSEE